MIQLALCRPKRSGSFEAADADRLARLGPSIIRAHGLHSRLQLANARAHGLASALNRLSDGIVLLTSDIQIDFANPAAVELSGSPEDWIRTACGSERPAASGSGKKLVMILREAARRPGLSSRVYSCAPMPGRAPLIIDMEPIARGEMSLGPAETPHLLLTLRAMRKDPDIDREALIDIFRLTPRECAIAVDVARGLSPKDIASTSGLTLNTLRFYLKVVFDKAGVSTQSTLGALVNRYQTRRR